MGFNAYYVIIGLLIAGYLFVPAVTTVINGIVSPILTAIGLSSAGVGGGAYHGNVNFVVSQMNELTGAAASPTTPVYQLHTSMPTVGSIGKAITVTGTVYDVPATSNGVIFVECFAGTDFYNDFRKIKALNPYVSDVIWTDYDVDGTDECLVKMDVSKISGLNPQTNPTLTLSLPLVADDVALAVDDPGDQTLGATVTTSTLTYTISSFAAGEGTEFEKVYFTTNATSVSGYIQFKAMRISGGTTTSSQPKLNWVAPIYEDAGTAYGAWYVKGSQDVALNDYNDYNNDLLAWRRTGEADTLTVSVDFECTLAKHVVVTSHFVSISANGVLTAELTSNQLLKD